MQLDAHIVLVVTLRLRRGELLGLKWSDIDLNEGKMTINNNSKYNRLFHYKIRFMSLHSPASISSILKNCLVLIGIAVP